MHKFVLTATAAALSVASSAAMADGDWSGFHVDGHVDAGWMTTNWSGFDGAEGDFTTAERSLVAPLAAPVFVDTVHFHAKNHDMGWGGGVGVGYNWQFDNVVLGAVADWTWLRANDTKSFVGAEGDVVTVSSKVDSVGTVRAILGFAGDRVMPYVTGGWAWGSVHRRFTADHDIDPIRFNVDADGGWTGGGGINFALSPRTNINAEVLYVDFGSDSKHIVNEFSEAQARVDSHLVLGRLGIQFRF